MLILGVLLLAFAPPQFHANVLPAMPDAHGGDAQPLADELPEYIPSEGNLRNRQWFRQAGFGLFIHWGVYSLLGRGEWVLNNDRLTLEQYQELPPNFNPVDFNATEWALMAKDAGMSYITFTSKHHDGFCMWHTKQTTWNIVDSAAYGKDILKMLAQACKVHGLKLFVYYSPLDWSHPDFYPRGFTGLHSGRPESGNWNNYLQYMNRQIEEILTEYEDIAGIWLDGWWDRPSHETWRTEETYQLIHRLKPDVLIGNNHHRTPFWGEDIQIFEKDAPGENTHGFAHSSLTVEEGLPLETCDTLHLNGAWGYTADHRPKDLDEVIKLLVRTAGFDANLLLNIGPMPSGAIQAEMRQTLELVGPWMRQYGHTVQGARGGPSHPQEWGVTTYKGDAVWVHVLIWPEDEEVQRVTIHGLNPEAIASTQVISCHPPLCFEDETHVMLERGAGGTTVMQLQDAIRDDIDTIVEVKLKPGFGGKQEL